MSNVAAHPRLHRFQAAVGCRRVFGGLSTRVHKSRSTMTTSTHRPCKLRMPLRLADDSEAVLLVRSEGHRIVGPDIRKDLFVTLPPCCFEGGRKEAFGDPLPPASEVNIGPDYPDMIEGVRVGCKRRHALKTDDDVVGGPHRDVKDVAWCESFDIRTLGLDRERCVEQRQ